MIQLAIHQEFPTALSLSTGEAETMPTTPRLVERRSEVALDKQQHGYTQVVIVLPLSSSNCCAGHVSSASTFAFT
jgi:hypothetical protein